MLRKTNVLSILLLPLLLAACGETKLLPSLVTQRLEVPESLLTCAPPPAPRPVSTQADVALLLLDLAEAGEDCRAKLAAVKDVVAP